MRTSCGRDVVVARARLYGLGGFGEGDWGWFAESTVVGAEVYRDRKGLREWLKVAGGSGRWFRGGYLGRGYDLLASTTPRERTQEIVIYENDFFLLVSASYRNHHFSILETASHPGRFFRR
ncbi:unnamed protein product [Sphenostylis stenocarpa]|uniref:Uncharacterized protein n=1 Tax=Sphenostylis stenocarpa TaxID=92480 RepID=A0AA86T3P9_9FABA|nr:unnamed protein product [Sphenostylis stenocarpa]